MSFHSESYSCVMNGVNINNNVFLLGFVVFKLNVETILNSNFHFNGRVEFRVSAQRVDDDVHLFSDVI